MALSTYTTNSILNTIKNNLTNATLVADTTTDVGGLLPTTVSSPGGIPLVWSVISPTSLRTSNSASNGTSLNFSIKPGLTANRLVLYSNTTIGAYVDLPTSRTGATTYGSGYYINYILITFA